MKFKYKIKLPLFQTKKIKAINLIKFKNNIPNSNNNLAQVANSLKALLNKLFNLLLKI